MLNHNYWRSICFAFSILLFAAPALAADSGDSGGSGKCGMIVFDCDQQKLTIGNGDNLYGKKEFDIACGDQTGIENGGGENKKYKLGEVTPAKGSAGLEPGTPVMQTEPLVCNNCAIHVGRVDKGAKSHGCIHVDQQAFDVLKECKGSEFSVKNKGQGSGEQSPSSTNAPG